MRTKIFACLALTALVISACDDPQAMPAPKNAEAPPLPPPSAPPPAPAMPAPLTEIPATSTSPEALAAFRAGEERRMNWHPIEARELLKKALSIDPSFVSATGLLGALTPDAEGDAMLAAAVSKASSLPPAEAMYLSVLQANHAYDSVKAAELGKKLVELAPSAWNAHYVYAGILWGVGKFDMAKSEYRAAIALNASAEPAWDDVGVLEAYLGEIDAAIVDLKKATEILPKEPNPQDSLGEAYMLIGKLDESESWFKKALESDPKFNSANTGIGFVNFYRGDYKKGNDAFAKYRDAAGATISDKSYSYRAVALGQVTQGKTADAFKTLDTLDAEIAKAGDVDAGAWATLTRIYVLIETGKPADALKVSAALLDRIEKSSSAESRKLHEKTSTHAAEALAYARLKKTAEAEKARAAVEVLVKDTEDADFKDDLALAKGEALLAKDGAAAGALAAHELKACSPTYDYCVLERLKAEDRAGLKLEAAADRAIFAKSRRRWEWSFYSYWAASKLPPPK